MSSHYCKGNKQYEKYWANVNLLLRSVGKKILTNVTVMKIKYSIS